jgi:hypothetical protein
VVTFMTTGSFFTAIVVVKVTRFVTYPLTERPTAYAAPAAAAPRNRDQQ